MSALQKIELHPAHTWDCDNCGRENFCRGVPHEMNPDDPQDAELIAIAKEANEESGMPITGFWITAPEEVTCIHCGTTYETEEQDFELP